MKAALIILNLLSTDPVIVLEYPTPEACLSAMQDKLLEKPPGVQALITCGPLIQSEVDGEESIDPPAKPKGEKIE